MFQSPSVIAVIPHDTRSCAQTHKAADKKSGKNVSLFIPDNKQTTNIVNH